MSPGNKRTYQTCLSFAPPVRVRRPDGGPRRQRAAAASPAAPAAAAAARGIKNETTPAAAAAAGSDDRRKANAENNGRVASVRYGRRRSDQIDSVDDTNHSDNDDGDDGDEGQSTANISKKERRRAAAARLRARRAGTRVKSRIGTAGLLEDTDDDGDEEEELKGCKTNAVRRKVLGGGRKKASNAERLKEDPEEDDDEDDFIVNSSSSSDESEDESAGKRRKVSHNKSDDSEEEECSDDAAKISTTRKTDSDNDNDSDDDDDDVDDGPMSYAALNFRMQMAQHEAERDEDLPSIMSAGRALSEREAFRVWLEDLAYQADAYMKRGGEEPYVSTRRQCRAARQVERPLCTRRESSLGSMAWRADFRTELSRRPIYRAFELHGGGATVMVGGEQRCDACGRTNHKLTHTVEFSGPYYDAARTWECAGETRNADWGRCLRPSPGYGRSNNGGGADNVETNKDDDDDDDDDAPVVSFRVGGHCRARTELYHTLLHYKYRLFDELRSKLSNGRTATVAVRSQVRQNGQTMDGFLVRRRRRDRGDGDGSKKGCDDGDDDAQERSATGSSTGTEEAGGLAVGDLLQDKAFVEREFERSRWLLQDADDNWGRTDGEQRRVKKKGIFAGSKRQASLFTG